MRLFLIFVMFLSPSAFSADLGNGSYGAVKIGMTAEDALRHLDGYSENKLPYDESSECYYLSLPEEKVGVHYMVFQGRVSRFDIDNEELNIITEQGIGIGSTKEEALLAYPEVMVSPHPYLSPEGEYLEVKLSNGNGLIFETFHNKITNFRLGSYPSLEYIEGCL